MTFLAPLFLVGALAAAVPIVLHLLKRDPESRVKFAVVKLLKQAPVEHTEKHRLRELLLLALRVASLVFLALAFARPFFASGEMLSATGATVIALDTSYSMSAPARFDRARQLAKDAVARAPSGDLVGVVTFADEAQIAAKPSSDRVLAMAAIDQAQPGFGATRYRSALSAAMQSLPGTRGTIVIVTDLQDSGWDAGDRVAVSDRVRVEIADVGALPPNLAVTSVRSTGDRVSATIHNTGPRARETHARLSIDGRPAGEVTATIAASQSVDLTFAAQLKGTAAAVSIDDPEGLAADNTRYAVLAGGTRPTVLIIVGDDSREDEAFYLRHALAAGSSNDRGYALDLIGGGRLSTTAAPLGTPARTNRAPGTPLGTPARTNRAPGTTLGTLLARYDAVLLVSTRGLERKGREALASYVQEGGGVMIAAGPEVDGDVAADVLGANAGLRIMTVDGTKPAQRTLAPADVRHPIFRPFAGSIPTLALVRFQNAARVEGSGCQTLARFTSGDTALMECAPGQGRAIVFASDLDNRWNDFPIHASFVPFVHEVVKYLSSARARGSEYFVGDVPPGIPSTPGVHLIGGSQSGELERHVAVNVDPREGDPARLTPEEFQSAVTRLKAADNISTAGGPGGPGGPGGRRSEARQQEDRQHLWQYALALMVITLTVEGFIASRTV